MTREEQKKVMDDILRELFSNGGPQRPANAGSVIVKRRECRALLAEQQRLIKTWGKK